MTAYHIKFYHMKVNSLKPFKRVLSPNEPVVSPSPVYLLSQVEYKQGNLNVIEVSNDLGLLFDAKRLSGLGNDGVKNFVDGLVSSSVNSSSNTAGMSDDQLMSVVKPRYVQSLSELKSWTDSLSQQMDNVRSKFNEVKSDYERYVKSLEESPVDVPVSSSGQSDS